MTASRTGPVPFDVGRSVYGTVLVMTVLAVDTTQGTPSYLEAAVTVLGAMLATFLAHVFADALSSFAHDGGGRGGHARRGVRTVARAARVDLVFLILAALPAAVLVVGALGAWEPETAIRIIMVAGVSFLVLVGALGGRRAGFGPWGVVACASAAGVLGAVLLVVQVLLEH
jgi:hypothetical protein